MKPYNPLKMISTAKSLGYSKIYLTNSIDSDEIKIVRRLDLNPKNLNELTRDLRSHRWKTEIIIVYCRTKSLARHAGKDRRVDLVSFPIEYNFRKNHLDKQQAKLMRDSGCGYLIDISQLLVNDPNLLYKKIKYIKRDKENALKKGVQIIASSCAVNIWGIRDPYNLAALLKLIDVDEAQALDMISTNPNRMADVNKKKLKEFYKAYDIGKLKNENKAVQKHN